VFPLGDLEFLGLFGLPGLLDDFLPGILDVFLPPFFRVWASPGNFFQISRGFFFRIRGLYSKGWRIILDFVFLRFGIFFWILSCGACCLLVPWRQPVYSLASIHFPEFKRFLGV
jgi:hypothetical protein